MGVGVSINQLFSAFCKMPFLRLRIVCHSKRSRFLRKLGACFSNPGSQYACAEGNVCLCGGGGGVSDSAGVEPSREGKTMWRLNPWNPVWWTFRADNQVCTAPLGTATLLVECTKICASMWCGKYELLCEVVEYVPKCLATITLISSWRGNFGPLKKMYQNVDLNMHQNMRKQLFCQHQAIWVHFQDLVQWVISFHHFGVTLRPFQLIMLWLYFLRSCFGSFPLSSLWQLSVRHRSCFWPKSDVFGILSC